MSGSRGKRRWGWWRRRRAVSPTPPQAATEVSEPSRSDGELAPQQEEQASQQDEPAPQQNGPLHRRSATDPRPLLPQPAVVLRARPHYQRITIGLFCALGGALALVIASASMMRLSDGSPLWPAVGNAAAALNVLIAFMQWRLWRLGLKEWEGKRDVALQPWLASSRVGVWLSVLGAVLVAFVADKIAQDSARTEVSWWLALGGTVLVVAGTVLAGMQSFNAEGPYGVPRRIRRNQRIHRDRLASQAPHRSRG